MKQPLKHSIIIFLIFSVSLLLFQPIVNTITKQSKISKTQTDSDNPLAEEDSLEEEDESGEPKLITEVSVIFSRSLNKNYYIHKQVLAYNQHNLRRPIKPPINIV